MRRSLEWVEKEARERDLEWVGEGRLVRGCVGLDQMLCIVFEGCFWKWCLLARKKQCAHQVHGIDYPQHSTVRPHVRKTARLTKTI